MKFLNPKAFKIALAQAELPAIAVARELGVHHSTISCWARGYYSVPEKYHSSLLSILKVSSADLFLERISPDQGVVL